MITSFEQLVLLIRSNRTLGIVCLAGAIVIGLNYWLWSSANELAIARRMYRVLPTTPIVVLTNLGKVMWGIANIILGWALWRIRRDLPVRDGRRWPSLALAANCIACATACFLDVAIIFFPVFLIRTVVIHVAAWTTTASAVLFPLWLAKHRVEITKE